MALAEESNQSLHPESKLKRLKNKTDEQMG